MGVSFVAILASSKTEVRGESPFLHKPSFCRSGFSRDHRVIEDGGLRLKSFLQNTGRCPA
jgi:hypothetical protein